MNTTDPFGPDTPRRGMLFEGPGPQYIVIPPDSMPSTLATFMAAMNRVPSRATIRSLASVAMGFWTGYLFGLLFL